MHFVNKVQNENHDFPAFFLWEGREMMTPKIRCVLNWPFYCLYLSVDHSFSLFLLPYVSRCPVIIFREVQNCIHMIKVYVIKVFTIEAS